MQKPQDARMNVVVFDNGGETLKAGFAGQEQPTCVVPNCTARVKNQLQQLVADETVTTVKDLSQLVYTRPVDRGYLVNINCEKEVFERVLFQRLKVKQPRECSLLMTEPVFTMDHIHDSVNELVFEEFGFSSLCCMPPAYLSTIDHQQRHPDSAFADSFCQVVVDAGFSFTHIIPIFNSRVIRAGVRRINIGGKFLTNFLKETVSYRQWNMMDDTAIVNHVKEALCYCSLDFEQEMRRTELSHETRKEYVLPDYQARVVGYVKGDEPGSVVSATLK